MRRILVLGKTNAGKTLFTLHFAEYLGARHVTIKFTQPQGGTHVKDFTITEAITFLVSNTPHQTRSIQSIVLTIPWGKGARQVEIMDTTGLIDGIHQDENVRKAIAQTLAAVRQADIIFHVLDCSLVGQNGVVEAVGDVDYQVAQFAQLRGGYLLLPNKIDLPQTQANLERIYQEFPGHSIIPISALQKQGFKEVRDFVRQQL